MISSNREKVRKDLKISIDDFNTLTEELFHNPSSCIQKKKTHFDEWRANYSNSQITSPILIYH